MCTVWCGVVGRRAWCVWCGMVGGWAHGDAHAGVCGSVGVVAGWWVGMATRLVGVCH